LLLILDAASLRSLVVVVPVLGSRNLTVKLLIVDAVSLRCYCIYVFSVLYALFLIEVL
jgi:hypothetical protein